MSLNSPQNGVYGKDLEIDLADSQANQAEEEHFPPIDQSWGYSDPSGNDLPAGPPVVKSHTFPVVRRVSLDEVNLAVNQDASLHIQNEFGKANQPGGKFSIIPLETLVQVNYCWDVDLFKLQDEKLVSLPFGPKNWAWQIIVYPNGVGDATGQYLSCFLRTVKNDTEMIAENWTRPISHFAVRIKQPNMTGVAPVDYDPTTFLEQYSEPEFTEFSENTQGWGFHEFCQLPFPQEQVAIDGDKVRFEIEILGSMTVNSSTMTFDEVVPISTISNQQSVTSSVFGPEDCRWQIKFAPFTDQDGNLTHISAHLEPVHSAFELAMGSNWDRKISTFSLKLVHPVTNQVLASKCLTGTFLFTQSNPLAGWNDIMALDSLYNFATESALVSVEVTWDPELLLEHTQLGKAKLALSNVGNVQNLEDENSKLHAKVKQLNEAAVKLNDKLKKLEVKSARQEFAKEEVEELRSRLALVTEELKELRNTQEQYNVSQVRFSAVKEKLAGLRKTMEGEYSGHFDTPSEDDISNELKSCKSELAHVYHEKAQLELRLAQATSELAFVQRSARDGALLEPIASHEDMIPVELDPLEKIEQAMEMAKNEIKASTISLDEVNNTIADNALKSMSAVVRAGLIADMSMVQCGLDVANATLHEAAEHLHLLQDVSEFLQVQKDLKEIRLQFSQTKFSLEDFSVRRSSEALMIKSPVAPYPLSPYGSLNNLSPPPIGVPYNSNKKPKKSAAPQFNELEHHNDLKEINTKISNLADLLKKSVAPVANPSRPFRPQDIQPWAPRDRKGILDVKTLTRMLNEVSNRHKSGGVFTYFVFTTLLSFFVYSTIFIVCDPNLSSPLFDSYSEICDSFVLPVYHETRNYWHKSAEKIALDVLPYYGKRIASRAKAVKRLTEDTIMDTFNKAVKQGSDIKVPIEKLADPIHPLDPDAPKTSSTKSVKPLPESTTRTTQQRYTNTESENGNPGSIIGKAEEIISNIKKDEIPIDKTFPTVKPKTFEHTEAAAVASAEAQPTVSTSITVISSSVVIESMKPKPIITTVPVAPEIVSQVDAPQIKSPAIPDNQNVPNSEHTVEKITQSVIPSSSVESSIESSPPLAIPTESNFIERDSEEKIAQEIAESVAAPVAFDPESGKVMELTPTANASVEDKNTEPTTISSTVSEQIGNTTVEEPADQSSIPTEEPVDQPPFQPSVPSEAVAVPVEQEISPGPVEAIVSETSSESNLSPTPSVADESDPANANYGPTETFSSSPPHADHVNFREDKESYEKSKDFVLTLGDEDAVRDEL